MEWQREGPSGPERSVLLTQHNTHSPTHTHTATARPQRELPLEQKGSRRCKKAPINWRAEQMDSQIVSGRSGQSRGCDTAAADKPPNRAQRQCKCTGKLLAHANAAIGPGGGHRIIAGKAASAAGSTLTSGKWRADNAPSIIGLHCLHSSLELAERVHTDRERKRTVG